MLDNICSLLKGLIVTTFVSSHVLLATQSMTLVKAMQLWPAASFAAPANPKTPSYQLTGKLTLSIDQQMQFQILTDDNDLLEKLEPKLTSLPAIAIDVITADTYIIPMQRGVQRTEHPYWEYLFEPGRVWQISEFWSKASLPFAFSERNGNCTHNGLIDFLFNARGVVKDARLQLTTETCAYLKFNLQGKLSLEFNSSTAVDPKPVYQSYLEELNNQIPVYSLSQLAADYPGLEMKNLEPKDLLNTTQYGLLINNRYYSSPCLARSGDYPFCEHFALPSFSLAKSIFAGLSYLYIASHYDDFTKLGITDYVPECTTNH